MTRKPRGRLPILTTQECEDIRASYFDKNSRETLGSLTRLYRVSRGTILKIANGTYKPRDDLTKD